MTFDFDKWLLEYMEFRAKCALKLGLNVPSDAAGLQKESQELEPMLWDAERHRAWGVGHYYKAKLTHTDALVHAKWPKSALDGTAKAKAYKELWAREDSEGLCKAISSRGFKISQHLKLLGAA